MVNDIVGLILAVMTSVGLSVLGNYTTTIFDSSVISLSTSVKFLFETTHIQKNYKEKSVILKFVKFILSNILFLSAFYYLMTIEKSYIAISIIIVIFFIAISISISQARDDENSNKGEKNLCISLWIFGIVYMDFGIIEYFSPIVFSSPVFSKVMAFVVIVSGLLLYFFAEVMLDVYRRKDFLNTRVVYLVDKSTNLIYESCNPIVHFKFKNFNCLVKDGSKYYFVTSNYEIHVVSEKDDKKHILKKSIKAPIKLGEKN